MDNESRIAELEELLNMAYDSLDERISRLESKHIDTITKIGIVAPIVIGIIQIIISLVK
ncbi:MAG: hypothetical protein IJQ77_06850 [Synergistaceae bacterium]|nr:hypothetical protein [Synergistaceae bacterium]MBR0250784.1 hypothetical protein [Synergistaceae bacterium]